MIEITLDIDTGVAKLARTTTIKAGVAVPVKVTLSRDPAAAVLLLLTIGTAAAPSSVLAFLDASGFTATNATTFTGSLDATDTRLVNYMASKAATQCYLQVAFTLGSEAQQIAPNMAIGVEAKIGDNPDTTDGGPTYYTTGETDTLLASKATIDPANGALLLGSNQVRILPGAGTLDLQIWTGSAWSTVQHWNL